MRRWLWVIGVAWAGVAHAGTWTSVDARYSVGEATLHERVAVFPVRDTQARTTPAADYVLLADALAAGTATVKEAGDGSVPTLALHNTGSKPVLAMAGDVVRGGKQDRVIAEDTLVPAGEPVSVAVNCVEQGRWSHSTVDRAFAYGGKGELDLKRTLELERDQGRTWEKVAELNGLKAQQAAEEPCRLLQQPALLLAARGRGLQPLAPFLTSFVTLLRAAA